MAVRVPENHCLNCKHVITAATSVTGMPDLMPTPGDVSICTYCGDIAVYAQDLTLREPTATEAFEIAGDKELIAAVEAVYAKNLRKANKEARENRGSDGREHGTSLHPQRSAPASVGELRRVVEVDDQGKS